MEHDLEYFVGETEAYEASELARIRASNVICAELEMAPQDAFWI